MKAVLGLISMIALASAMYAQEESIISASSERNAKVIGIVKRDGAANEVKLLSDGKIIWTIGLAYGYPNQAIVSWSPHSTKVAISIRTTKTTSEIHVFDIWEKQKEIPIPDIGEATHILVAKAEGRHFLVSPVGWVDENILVAKVCGNLVDSITDGQDDYNFTYVHTIELSTGRMLGTICTSSHDLRKIKKIEQDAALNSHSPGG